MADAIVSTAAAPVEPTVVSVVKTDISAQESKAVTFIKTHASKAIAAGAGFAVGQLHLANLLIKLL
jgi:hypothetical protein